MIKVEETSIPTAVLLPDSEQPTAPPQEDPPTDQITKLRLSDDTIVLVLTSGYAVLIAAVWLVMGRPLAG